MSDLIEIQETSLSYNVILDLKYATEDNVTGKAFYNKAICYLHKDALDKMDIATKLANELGYKFRIFDAFRPLEGQQALWDFSPDEDFVSNPETGSCPHCRGVAIDLTLTDNNGKNLEMGTGFDDFTPLSHHANTDISKEAQKNRLILLGIMTAAGWDNYKNEWWHYQLFNARNYELLRDSEIRSGIIF